MEKVKVLVKTVPNGYVLTFKNDEYMYYTLPALLEGFMYHVGLEELAATDADTIREFLTAAVVWKDQGETVKELVKTKKENKTLSNMVKNLRKQVKRLRERMNEGDGND